MVIPGCNLTHGLRTKEVIAMRELVVEMKKKL